MRPSLQIVLPAVLLAIAPALAPRHTEPRPEDFSRLIGSADTAFQRRQFTTAVDNLQRGILIAKRMLRESVIATFPPPPRGWAEIERPPRIENTDPLANALAAGMSTPVEQRYRLLDGRGGIRILVNPNAAVAPHVRRSIDRPGDDAQRTVIEIDRHRVLLERNPTDLVLRTLIGDSHLVEVRAFGIDEDALLRMIDARFLGRLAAALR